MMIKQGVKYRLIFCHLRIGTNDGSLKREERKSWVNNRWQSSHPEYFLNLFRFSNLRKCTKSNFLIRHVHLYDNTTRVLSCNNIFLLTLNWTIKGGKTKTFQFFGLVSASRIGNNCIHDFKIQKETPKLMQVATAQSFWNWAQNVSFLRLGELGDVRFGMSKLG